MDNKKKGKLAITATCVVLGMMLAFQFNNAQKFKNSYSNQRVEDLARRLTETERAKESLQKEVDDLRQGIPEEAMRKEKEQTRAFAGLIPMKGPGVMVTVDDSKRPSTPGENANLYIMHDEDILKVINELRASGAEALAVNEQRLIATSEIRCVGPTLLVNDVKYSPPYEISAIGDPKTLEAALRLRGGVVETLQFWGVQIQIKQQDEILIPAYRGNFRFELAKPVEQEAKK